jgi:adenylate cyclase
VIDKFIGDAIMAFFGAPIAAPGHGPAAVRAALAALETSAAIAAELRARGLPPIRTRIGVHSGPALVGNMGSAERFDYTAIGDTVNLASRLEGANKAFGTRILVSETTWAGAGGAVSGREVGLVGVKGRDEPIRVYEPWAVGAALQPAQQTALARHAEALAHLRRGDLGAALGAFEALAAARPDDDLVALYVERLADPAWDGVWRLDSK